MRCFLFFFILSCSLWACEPKISDGTAGAWNIVKSGSEKKLTSIFFINNSKGWAVGDNVILNTENGGRTWSRQLDDYLSNFTCIWFIDENTGWVAGAGGKILKTTNGGTSWKDLSVENKKSFHDIRFANANKGWAVGYGASPDGALVATSEDGGQTWLNQLFVNTNHVYNGKQVFYSMDKIFALDDKHVWTSGNGQWLVYSQTGGTPWTDISDLTPLGQHQSIYFHDQLNGWILSPPGKIYKTSDGGKTWNFVFQHIHDLFAITFTDKLRGWVVGNYNNILATNDGGKTWKTTIIDLEYTSNLNQVFFTDSLHGWIVGNNGVILRYWK